MLVFVLITVKESVEGLHPTTPALDAVIDNVGKAPTITEVLAIALQEPFETLTK